MQLTELLWHLSDEVESGTIGDNPTSTSGAHNHDIDTEIHEDSDNHEDNDLPWFDSLEDINPGAGYTRQYKDIK